MTLPPKDELLAAGGALEAERVETMENTPAEIIASPAPAGRDQRGRFAKGHGLSRDTQFQPGNETRLVHGLRRRNPLADRPEVQAALAEERHRYLLDLGGPDVSAGVDVLATDAARLNLMIADVFDRVIAGGLLTRNGKQSPSVGVLLGLMDRRLRIWSALGLERKAKPAASLDAYLAAHYGTQRPQDASVTATDPNIGHEVERPADANVDQPQGDGGDR